MPHFRDKLGVGIRAWVGGEEAGLIGQQQQQVRFGQQGDQRRQVVVVADLDLGGCHRVVLVDDRHDAVFQQRGQHVARVQEAIAIGHVGAGQQHLPDMEAVEVEQALPDVHQPALAHGRQHLLGRDGGRQVGMVQPLPPGRDGPGGDDDHLAALAAERGALPGDLDHVRAVELPCAAGEHAGAEFDNDAFVHEPHSAAQARTWLGVTGSVSSRVNQASRSPRAANSASSSSPPR